MNRFYFLEEKHPDIYALCIAAEQAKQSDASVALLKARQALEKIIYCVNPKNKGDEDLFTQISELSDLGIVTEDELAAFHTVRRTANRAVHGEAVAENEGTVAIDSLFKIAGWLTFYVEHHTCDSSTLSDADQKLIWPYIKTTAKHQNKIHYDLLNQGIDPLALDIPLDVEEEPVDILQKDVFETDEEYVQRIKAMPPVHLGYCMLDKSKADAFTHIIFPIYHLDKNDKIISQPIDAFFIVDNEKLPSIVDGEIVAKLKVFQQKVYFDYYHIQINLDNGINIPLNAISWQAYDYDTDEDVAKRTAELPILPIGMCRYIKQEYRITDGYLPANIWVYKYMKSIYQKNKAVFYVERDLAKQLCSTTHLFPIYAKISSDLKIQQVLAYEQKKRVILLENMPLNQDKTRASVLVNATRIQLAEKGTAHDKYLLGMDYLKGNGVAKNEKEAYKWIHMAYKDGDTDAVYVLSEFYRDGIGIEKDDRTAVKLLVEAIDGGRTEALQQLKKQGNVGDVNAQYELGKIYYKHKKNNQEAVKWFRMAAKQGHKESQEFLDSGVIPTFEALLKRADHDADAMYQVGMAFYNGMHYVEKDKEQALKWLKKAIDKGSIRAACEIFTFNCSILDVINELKEAVITLQIAYRNGNKVAESMLRNLPLQNSMRYNLGLVLSKYSSAGERKKGIKYIMNAAEGGNTEALCVVEKLAGNSEKGLTFIREAAELGYAEAQYRLGTLYYSGDGIQKDFSEGIKWIRRAAGQGHDKAKEFLHNEKIDLT